MAKTQFNIYDSLLKIETAINQTISYAEDYPPFYSDYLNLQLSEDLNKALTITETARSFYADADKVEETTEPATDWNYNDYLRNGGSLVTVTGNETERDYYGNGIYKDRIINRINSIYPNGIYYYIADAAGTIYGEFETVENAADGQKQLKAESDPLKLYFIRSARKRILYRGLDVDFTSLAERAITAAITKQPDAIYGNISEFINSVIDANRKFNKMEIEDRLNGACFGDNDDIKIILQ